ncbi:MAG: type II secretion system GspH family protein, partial [Candidatus Gastranaerophilales bacterium]|nr:type II secretion system GspH family protein [Candidatus Gastranaerophilales bacterium]
FSAHTKIFAFTLAETLITLAIIGVAAAMTIPAVLNHTKETQLKTGLKKAQSILSEALQLMLYETGIPINQENYTTRTFITSFRKYFSELKDCSYNSCITSSSHKSYNNGSIITTLLDDGQVIINDSMILAIENCSGGCGHGILISVDVNGLNKPNKWGHDLFTFVIDEETGALLPMGAPDTAYSSKYYCSKTLSNSYNGIACTYKALTEKDYFKNLP